MSKAADPASRGFHYHLQPLATTICLQSATIIPVPKKGAFNCPNDYRRVALTPTMTKRFWETHPLSYHSADLDQHQFACRANRLTEDTVNTTPHTALTHLDQSMHMYVRVLFVDFSSAFNTVILQKLIHKLNNLGLDSSLCTWILDFISNRPQQVRMGGCTSFTLILNTGTPQWCVLSPLLYSLFTHDCSSIHPTTAIVIFANDMAI